MSFNHVSMYLYKYKYVYEILWIFPKKNTSFTCLACFPPQKKNMLFLCPFHHKSPWPETCPNLSFPAFRRIAASCRCFCLDTGGVKSIPRCCEKKLQLSSLMVSSNPRKGLCTNWLDDSQWERMCHSKLSSSYSFATTHFKQMLIGLDLFPEDQGKMFLGHLSNHRWFCAWMQFHRVKTNYIHVFL